MHYVLIALVFLSACSTSSHVEPSAQDAGSDASDDAGVPTSWLCYCHAPEVATTCVPARSVAINAATEIPLCTDTDDDPSDMATQAHCAGSDDPNCFCTCTSQGPSPLCREADCVNVYPPAR